jgi:hypothetical protein
VPGPGTFRAQLHGVEAVQRKYDHAPKVLGEEIGEAVAEVSEAAREMLMEYPAPPAGSTYERTFELKRGWAEARAFGRGTGGQFSVGAGTQMVTLTNAVEYVPLVQGDRQARVHQGRWQTIRDVEGKVGPLAKRSIGAARDRAARRLD